MFLIGGLLFALLTLRGVYVVGRHVRGAGQEAQRPIAPVSIMTAVSAGISGLAFWAHSDPNGPSAFIARATAWLATN